jgi:hypothetical protein
MVKRYKFEHMPIIIMDKAMSFHKLKIPDDETFDFLISSTDFDALKSVYISSTANLPWEVLLDEKNNRYHSRWYNLSYQDILTNAIKTKSKIVVDKQSMLFMYTLISMDKKNRIPSIIKKKYMQDMISIANSYI